MKKLIITFQLLLILSLTFAQTNKCSCYEKKQYNCFLDYKKDSNLIERNWKQYFFEDISALNKANVSQVPLFFDSYGCLYPDLNLFSGLGDEIIDNINAKNYTVEKHAIAKMFEANKSLFLERCKALTYPGEREKCESLLNSLPDDSTFCDIWQKFYVAKTVKAIESKLDGKKNKILFFIHGYNVPYSLAQIQLQELLKTMKDSLDIDIQEFLVIPVYWSSNDQKHCEISSCDKFRIDDRKNVNNAKAISYHSNRCYYVSIELRKIINSLEPLLKEKEVYVFAHSLGNTIATSLVTNTVSKLQSKWEYRKDFNPYNLAPSVNKMREVIKNDINETITYEILSGFHNTPIPKTKIKFFMSAPAIPGYGTFVDFDRANEAYFSFFATLNTGDDILNKRIFHVKIGANRRGRTSLGTKQDDMIATKLTFSNKEKFKYEYLQPCFKHDVFYYLQQPLYKSSLKFFFSDKF